MRAENHELWHTIERNEDAANENRILRSQMREAEVRYDETVEHLSCENFRLRRHCQELYKTIQELELRNASKSFAFRDPSVASTRVRKLSQEGRKLSHEGRRLSNDARQKSSSVGSSLDKLGLGDPESSSSFAGSKLRHGSSTPTLHLMDSVSRKSPVVEDFGKQRKASTSMVTSSTTTVEERTPDASYFDEPQDVKRPIFSIKTNPFLKYDKYLETPVNMVGRSASPLMKRSAQQQQQQQQPQQQQQQQQQQQPPHPLHLDPFAPVQNDFYFTHAWSGQEEVEQDHNSFVASLKKTINENLRDQYVHKLRESFENV